MNLPPVPLEIHKAAEGLEVTWDEGHRSFYPYRMLRLACRCASCREEVTDRPLLDPSTVKPDVRAQAVELVGSYAIKITWDDGHDTGIYTYEHLLALCPCQRCRSQQVADPGSGPESAAV